MTYRINPFIGALDYYQDHYVFASHDTDTLLVGSDMKKIHVMDVSAGERAFWLPHADTSLIGQWIGLLRKGTANILRVWANGSDVIFNSSAGGYLECSDAHDYSCLFLFVVEDGVWGNPSFGIWTTH